MQVARANTSGRVTHYVVQGFRKVGRKIVPDEPKIARDEAHCLRLAQQASASRTGVVAFSRTGDLDTGDFDDPVFLAQHGDVPEFS